MESADWKLSSKKINGTLARTAKETSLNVQINFVQPALSKQIKRIWKESVNLYLQFAICKSHIKFAFMRSHNGMRPQDVPILLKIIAKGTEPWQNKDLAAELYISASEISESLHRSLLARLVDSEKKRVHRLALLEFIAFGLPCVFPANPGPIVNGMPTAHSHPFMRQFIFAETLYVWPLLTANDRGPSIEPLYKEAAKAALQDEKFYKLLALVDTVRVGRTRELKVAMQELNIIFENE